MPLSIIIPLDYAVTRASFDPKIRSANFHQQVGRSRCWFAVRQNLYTMQPYLPPHPLLHTVTNATTHCINHQPQYPVPPTFFFPPPQQSLSTYIYILGSCRHLRADQTPRECCQSSSLPLCVQALLRLYWAQRHRTQSSNMV